MSESLTWAKLVKMREVVTKTGLSIFCASCDHYWAAQQGQAPDALVFCQAPGPCGGPLRGMDFPHYKGILPDFFRFCFVCGEESVQGLRAQGTQRMFGVCGAHGPKWLTSMTPDATVVLYLTPVKGGAISLMKKPILKPSLLDAMNEFEAQHAKSEASD